MRTPKDKLVIIKARNIDVLEKTVFPAGIDSLQAKVNFALGEGLKYLVVSPLVAQTARGDDAGDMSARCSRR